MKDYTSDIYQSDIHEQKYPAARHRHFQFRGVALPQRDVDRGSGVTRALFSEERGVCPVWPTRVQGADAGN